MLQYYHGKYRNKLLYIYLMENIVFMQCSITLFATVFAAQNCYWSDKIIRSHFAYNITFFAATLCRQKFFWLLTVEERIFFKLMLYCVIFTISWMLAGLFTSVAWFLWTKFGHMSCCSTLFCDPKSRILLWYFAFSPGAWPHKASEKP